MRIYTNSLQSRSASSYLVYRVLFDDRAAFCFWEADLPIDEAGFRVAEPTFDEAQTLL